MSYSSSSLILCHMLLSSEQVRYMKNYKSRGSVKKLQEKIPRANLEIVTLQNTVLLTLWISIFEK